MNGLHILVFIIITASLIEYFKKKKRKKTIYRQFNLFGLKIIIMNFD